MMDYFETKSQAIRWAKQRKAGFRKLKTQTTQVGRKQMLNRAIKSVKVKPINAFGKKSGYRVIGM